METRSSANKLGWIALVSYAGLCGLVWLLR